MLSTSRCAHAFLSGVLEMGGRGEVIGCGFFYRLYIATGVRLAEMESLVIYDTAVKETPPLEPRRSLPCLKSQSATVAKPVLVPPYIASQPITRPGATVTWYIAEARHCCLIGRPCSGP